MLLVQDVFGRLASVRPEQVATPFRPLSEFRTVEQARDFLARFERGDSWFRAALTEEITRGWASDLFSLTDGQLILAAAEGIATGAITLATPIVPDPKVTFDAARPRAPGLDFVGFPNRAIAFGFVAFMQADRGSARNLRDALRHEAAMRGVVAVAPDTRLAKMLQRSHVGRREREAIEVDLTAEQITHLLTARWLRLIPLGLNGALLQLAWRHTGSGTDDTDGAGSSDGAGSNGSAADAPARRPVRPPAPTTAAPQSTLPLAPTTPPRQAECMRAAAQQGAPLVDECPAPA